MQYNRRSHVFRILLCKLVKRQVSVSVGGFDFHWNDIMPRGDRGLSYKKVYLHAVVGNCDGISSKILLTLVSDCRAYLEMSFLYRSSMARLTL